MKTMIEYAKSFIGKPYIWGGDDPMRGFDCSGLVQEILASGGFDPAGDQTSHGLYEIFREKGSPSRKAGALAFFGTHEKITHVAFMIDEWRMIEAAGGNSKTTSEAAAIRQNAYIRIRPINHRSDLVATYMPPYEYMSYGKMSACKDTYYVLSEIAGKVRQPGLAPKRPKLPKTVTLAAGRIKKSFSKS